MQNDKGKYVPPPLRGGAGPQESSYSGGRSYGGGYGRDDGGNRGGGGYRDRDGPRGGYDNRGGYDRPQYSRGGWGGSEDGRSGGYDGPTNSRWKSFESGGGGGGGYRGGYSGYGSGYAPRTNSKGYHGDERPNPRVEAELFNSEAQTTGINFDKYDDIPVEVSEGCPEPYNEFTLETLGEQLLRNVHLANFSKPTPVQKYSIPIGLAGGDMMACAQTGSGKTAGFLFPIITGMLHFGPLQSNNPTAYRTTHPTALILAPTRELAVQIQEEAQKFCYCTGIRSVVVYGGANIQNQMRDLERGADILVATPGRLVDLIERDRISLDIIRYLILDEADRMLDMGFEPQIRRIVEGENMPTNRQTFMFSATFPVEIQRLAADFMKDYIFLAVGRVGAASKDVNQSIVWVEQHAKMDYILDFLNSSKTNDGLILIFVETKRGADTLEQRLRRLGFPAASIHGDKSQREREDALRYFKTGECPILVATDVAARGLDIPHVTQVINFDLPSNIDDYVHRIGRTGRVGNIGYALSLMNDKNRNIAKDLAELLLENDLDCPHWLEKMYQSSFGGGGGRGRGRGRGGGRFGSRDMRKDKGYSGFKMSQVSGPPAGSSGGYKQERHVPSDNSAW